MTVIDAAPIDRRRCKFVVDRPLYPGRWAYFADRASLDRENAPLPARLFRLPEVESLLLSHDKVTITRTTSTGLPILSKALRVVRALTGDQGAVAESWRRLGKVLGAEIRSHLESGEPAVVDPGLIVLPSSLVLKARVEDVLENEVNPVIAGHGGGVSLVDLIDNVVYLRMSGGCQGCGLADLTLKHGVEAAIRDAVPEIGEIIDLTDHAGGLQPFMKANGKNPGAISTRSPFR